MVVIVATHCRVVTANRKNKRNNTRSGNMDRANIIEEQIRLTEDVGYGRDSRTSLSCSGMSSTQDSTSHNSNVNDTIKENTEALNCYSMTTNQHESWIQALSITSRVGRIFFSKQYLLLEKRILADQNHHRWTGASQRSGKYEDPYMGTWERIRNSSGMWCPLHSWSRNHKPYICQSTYSNRDEFQLSWSWSRSL